jgi:hypothetical protein
MVRVATHAAAFVLVDCVSPEDPEKRPYQNRLKKLRTPSKTYVYSEPQLVAALEQVGLMIAQRVGCSAHWDLAHLTPTFLRSPHVTG